MMNRKGFREAGCGGGGGKNVHKEKPELIKSSNPKNRKNRTKRWKSCYDFLSSNLVWKTLSLTCGFRFSSFCLYSGWAVSESGLRLWTSLLIALTNNLLNVWGHSSFLHMCPSLYRCWCSLCNNFSWISLHYVWPFSLCLYIFFVEKVWLTLSEFNSYLK